MRLVPQAAPGTNCIQADGGSIMSAETAKTGSPLLHVNNDTEDTETPEPSHDSAPAPASPVLHVNNTTETSKDESREKSGGADKDRTDRARR
jgi:hypothetical protein